MGSLGGLSKLFHERFNSGQNVCEVALDEIDTLLDDTFKVRWTCIWTLLSPTLPIHLDGEFFVNFDPNMARTLDDLNFKVKNISKFIFLPFFN